MNEKARMPLLKIGVRFMQGHVAPTELKLRYFRAVLRPEAAGSTSAQTKPVPKRQRRQGAGLGNGKERLRPEGLR